MYTVTLAALLHDIGKVGQRAHKYPQGLSTQTLNMEQELCPFNKEKSYFSHRHVLYTNEFFNHIENSLACCFDKTEISEIINLATRHHKPDTNDIIHKADCLSSGHDRAKNLDYEGDWSKARIQRLIPILGEVFSSEGNRIDGQYAHDFKEWSEDYKTLFPVPLQKTDLDYLVLWKKLISGFNIINTDKQWEYIAQALNKLETLTWCVPSATTVTPDISLYDHNRLTAAIAACLFSADEKDKPFILLTGDFGGIQRYIFDIQHGTGNSAKRLRGRSFKVRYIVEKLIFDMLYENGIPITNKILSAGGKFHLLLPNTKVVKESISQQSQRLDAFCLKETDGEIRISLGYSEFSAEDIEHFSDCITRVNAELQRNENRAFETSLIKEAWDPESFKRQFNKAEGKEICAFCGKKFGDYEHDSFICSSCKDEIEVGGRLPKKQGIAFYSDKEQDLGKVVFFNDNESNRKPSLNLLWDSSGNSENIQPVVRIAYANNVPVEDHEILTFEEIAGEAVGYKALGFLKADVDNLGYTMAFGLKKEKQTGAVHQSISRFSCISRYLEYFFGGYIGQLIREKFSNVYLVYSGGDDLLAVGPWNEIIDFAIELRKEFSEYTCMNSAWGFSAGIVVGGSKTPLLEAVEMANESLELSKQRDENGKTKDALSLWGQTLSWDAAGKAIEKGREIASWLENETVSTGQIRRLLYYSQLYCEYKRTNDTAYLKYIILLLDDLNKNWKENTDEEKQAKEWVNKLTDPHFEGIENLKVSCIYALYLRRTNKEMEE